MFCNPSQMNRKLLNGFFVLSILRRSCKMRHKRRMERWNIKEPCGRLYKDAEMRDGLQGAPGLVMGPCIVEIDRIVIREVQYQLEVNRLKGIPILGGCGLCGPGAPGLVMGLCIVEIDRIVIRIVQYQLEVNRCRNKEIIVKGNFVWVWPREGRPRYQLQVNQCRNEEVIVKGNFGWVWPMWVGRLRIDRIVMHMNRCRNEEIIVKGNFGWVWSMWAVRPRIDRIVIREVQYQFEVNRCRNEEVNEIVARTDGQTDGQTDRRTVGRRR
ncbi:hypothetical protein DPMN_089058 [Dreissena polymorpha]|uniref:Uncharacterized protein n=1 Tax=Dreissena polymorpha TaxID=45954 RepID=A0A9D4KW41_DREPO|nr:hypothetical protein DPMN_089058 [Dreissena polymorpha]